MTDVKLPCRNTVNKSLLLLLLLFIVIVVGYPKTKEPNFWLKLNGRNARIRKTYVIYFLLYGVSSRKKSVLDATEPKNRTVLKKVHEEVCLLGIKIFWMRNKTIIEFSFRMLWRIMPISEAIIHLSLRHSPRSA